MSIVKVLLGPPGTGKTTTLLNSVEYWLNRNTDPERIAFVSFTKAACDEARDRACKRFGFDEERIPYFKNIHSIARQMIGGSGAGEVMAAEHWKDFGESCRYEFSEGVSSDLPFFAAFVTDGDQIRQIHDLSRLCLCSIDQAMMRVRLRGLSVSSDLVRIYAERLASFKAEHNLIDFTDMLELALKTQHRPSVSYAFIDEVQDLCPLQLKVIRHWFFDNPRVAEVTLAGDDDQAIFTWAGADPDALIEASRKHPTEILRQSYRIPSSVHSFAQQIVRQNKNRVQKEYLPRSELGSLCRVSAPALSKCQGSTMVLVRNKMFARRFYECAMAEGRIFSSEAGKNSPLDHVSTRNAYLGLAGLRANKPITGKQFVDLLEKVPSKVDGGALLPHGVKTKAAKNEGLVTVERAFTEFGLEGWLGPVLACELPFATAFLRLQSLERTYLDRVHARFGLALPETPEVVITTQHKSKGREADTVIVCPDMARASHNELMSGDREAENRVAYVAATRARHSLQVLTQETSRYYPFPVRA